MNSLEAVLDAQESPNFRAHGNLPARTSQQTWIGDGLPFDRERVKRAILDTEQRIVEDLISVGSYLAWAKAEIGHGEWSAFLDELGMSLQRAHEYMTVSRLVLDPNRGQFMQVASGQSISKLVLLAALPEQEIDRAVAHGEIFGRPIDDVSTLTYRELRAEVSALKKSTIAHDTPDPQPTNHLPAAPGDPEMAFSRLCTALDEFHIEAVALICESGADADVQGFLSRARALIGQKVSSTLVVIDSATQQKEDEYDEYGED